MTTLIFFTLLSFITFTLGLVRNPYKHSLIKMQPPTVEARIGEFEKKQNIDLDILENVDGYPEEEIKSILNITSGPLYTFFGNVFKPYEDVVFETRLADETDSFCKIRQVTVRPKKMTNIRKENKTIVNVDPTYIQSVVYERCNFNDVESSFCGKYNSNLPFSYKSFCKQKYTVIRLLTYNDDKKTVAYDHFKFPSSCVCTYEIDKSLYF